MSFYILFYSSLELTHTDLQTPSFTNIYDKVGYSESGFAFINLL